MTNTKTQNTLNSLKGLTKLNESVKIYVPSTFNGSEPINNDNEVLEVQKELSTTFGGSTTYKAQGSFIMDDGSLVIESVNIVEAFTDTITNEDIDIILTIAQDLKNNMQQEAISIEINNKLYFI